MIFLLFIINLLGLKTGAAASRSTDPQPLLKYIFFVHFAGIEKAILIFFK